jgi:hypothetical protein
MFFLFIIYVVHREYPKVAVGILVAVGIIFIIFLFVVFWSDLRSKSKKESIKQKGINPTHSKVQSTQPIKPPVTTAKPSTSTVRIPKPRAFEPVLEVTTEPKTQYTPARKANWPEFQKIVSSHKISALYHFTDASNLPSIRAHGGLFSWDHCQKQGIVINRRGSNDLSRTLDKHKGLEDFVRLTFNRKPPMLVVACNEGRIIKPHILLIDPEVMYWEGTQFSDINATANNSRIGPKIEHFKAIQFSVATKDDCQEDRGHHQAEVLVKNHIPINFIRNI